MTLPYQLSTLEASGLLRLAQIEPELEYLFRHVLVQDAAYESMLKSDRRILHRRVGETLEQLYPERLIELAPLLAGHFAEAGDDSRTLHYCRQAGVAAAQIYANAEAVQHYTRALDIAKRTPGSDLSDLYHRRGRALELLSHHTEALNNYIDMETVARQTGDRALELAALIAQATLRGTFTPVSDTAIGQRLSEQALALADELGDRRSQAKIFWNLLLLNRTIGNSEKAFDYGDQSLAIAREFDLREQMAYTLTDTSWGYAALGQIDRARGMLDEASQLWRELGNTPMLAETLTRKAIGSGLMGQNIEAIALTEEAYRLSQLTANVWGQAFSLTHLGLGCLFVGELSQGLAALDEALRLSERADLFFAPLSIYPQLALVYSELGALDQGFEVAQRMVALFEKFPTYYGDALIILAVIYARQGRLAEAQTTFDSARQKPLAPGNFLNAASLVQAEAELEVARSRYPEALAALDQALEKIHRLGMRNSLPGILYQRGRVLWALGRVEEAYATLNEARGLAEAMSLRLQVWRILAALAEIGARRGNQAEADSLRRQARVSVEYITDHCPPELRDSFLALPEVKQVLNSE